MKLQHKSCAESLEAEWSSDSSSSAPPTPYADKGKGKVPAIPDLSPSSTSSPHDESTDELALDPALRSNKETQPRQATTNTNPPCAVAGPSTQLDPKMYPNVENQPLISMRTLRKSIQAQNLIKRWVEDSDVRVDALERMCQYDDPTTIKALKGEDVCADLRTIKYRMEQITEFGCKSTLDPSNWDRAVLPYKVLLEIYWDVDFMAFKLLELGKRFGEHNELFNHAEEATARVETLAMLARNEVEANA